MQSIKQTSCEKECGREPARDPDSFDPLLNRPIYAMAKFLVGLFFSLVNTGETEEFINDFLSRKDGRFHFSML